MIVNTEETNPHSTAMIVSSYVRHHTLRPEQLSDLITTVHHALSHIGQPMQIEEVPVFGRKWDQVESFVI